MSSGSLGEKKFSKAELLRNKSYDKVNETSSSTTKKFPPPPTTPKSPPPNVPNRSLKKALPPPPPAPSSSTVLEKKILITEEDTMQPPPIPKKISSPPPVLPKVQRRSSKKEILRRESLERKEEEDVKNLQKMNITTEINEVLSPPASPSSFSPGSSLPKTFSSDKLSSTPSSGKLVAPSKFSTVSLESLVLQLITNANPPLFEKAFLSFLPVFAKPSVFLQELKYFFSGEKKVYTISSEEEQILYKAGLPTLQIRILEILKKWLELEMVNDDIRSDRDQSLPLIKSLIKSDKSSSMTEVSIKQTEVHEVYKKKIESTYTSVDTSTKFDTPLKKGGYLFSKSITDISEINIFKLGKAEEVAEQLTCLEFEKYYMPITARQMLNKCVEKDKLIGAGNCTYEKITEWINYIDKVSFWVVTEILIGRAPRAGAVDAVHLTETELIFMLDLSFTCFGHKNFSAVMEVVNGLNSPSLSRLQFFWEKIHDSDHSKKLSRMKMVADNTGGYKMYRSTLNNIRDETPCLPSLTVALKDLVGLHLGGGKFITSDGLINFDKVLGMSKIVEDFLKYQNRSYSKEITSSKTFKTENSISRFKFAPSSVLKKFASTNDVKKNEEVDEDGYVIINIKQNIEVMKSLLMKILDAKDPKDLFAMSKNQDMSAESAALAGSLFSSGFFS